MISIVIATYNRKDLLPRCIKSILTQTYQDFEIIIVDDGSTDGTENLFPAVFSDQRIKYFKLDHGGATRARNFGMDHMQGEYSIIWDSDDELLPNALERFSAQFIAYPDVSLVSATVDVVENGQKKKFTAVESDLFEFKDILMQKLPANAEIVMVKNAVIGSVRFVSRNLDYMFYHFIARDKKWFHLNEVLGMVYYSDISLTKSRKVPSVDRSLERLPYLVSYLDNFGVLLMKYNKPRYGRLGYATALASLLAGQNKKAASYAGSAFMNDKKLKYLLLFVFSFVPLSSTLLKLLYRLKALRMKNKTRHHGRR